METLAETARSIFLKRGGIHCMLPEWLVSLLPASGIWIGPQYISRREFLWAAAIVGAQRAEEALIGQVSFEGGHLVNVCFRSQREAELMESFAKSLYLTVPATILRTAIMLGLHLPGVEIGVISQVRTEKFTEKELQSIWAKAITWLNNG